jgi:hypothetical protein
MATQSKDEKKDQPLITQGGGQKKRDQFWTIVLIAVVVLILGVIVRVKYFKEKEHPAVGSSEQVSKVYRKVTLGLQENWSDTVVHGASQTIVVWGSEGMFFRTEKQGWVEKSYQDGISGLFGGAGANKLQFRGNPGDVVEYCIYPKGESWRVCQD